MVTIYKAWKKIYSRISCGVSFLFYFLFLAVLLLGFELLSNCTVLKYRILLFSQIWISLGHLVKPRCNNQEVDILLDDSDACVLPSNTNIYLFITCVASMAYVNKQCADLLASISILMFTLRCYSLICYSRNLLEEKKTFRFICDECVESRFFPTSSPGSHALRRSVQDS